MIRSIYYDANGKQRENLTVEEFTQALQAGKGLLWVDFEATPAEDDAPILLNIFGFHPLAVDDALQETHLAKVDDWENYLYIVMQSVSYTGGDEDIELTELDVFLGTNFIVTHHDLPIACLNRVWRACQQHERYLKLGADHILYKLADEMTVDYMQVVEAFDEEIEWIEDQVFERPSADMAQRIFILKRATMHLRRAVSPLREVLNRLARDDFAVVDKRDRVYFRDVYDHLVRLHDITEGLRDLVGGALDTYLSVINNRMNEVMKTLTVITTLFMPVSFLVGFFGMNFFIPDEPITLLMEKPFFIAVLVMMFITPISMLIWMRRRRWM